MGIVDDLKQSHMDVLNAVDGLTADDMTRPDTIGKWSARDVILHIAMWEGEVLKAFAVWRTGHDFDWNYAKDYLKFNEFWHQNLKHLTADQVMKMFNLTHAALIADASSIPDHVWDKRGGIPKWLFDTTVGHNSDHIPRLQAYRKSLGK